MGAIAFAASPWRPHTAAWIAVVVLCGTLAPASPSIGAGAIHDLKKLSLDELLDLEVELVSRTEQIAREAPAAIHVITEEDIRRSGARSIPEALRLAPNLQVAQTGSRGWAIAARGFNASFANKLLVLIDGRTVYSPLFSGVFWDLQDTLLEDIERIEVISGPGATLWGANAVNGIINVVLKSAEASPGLLLTAAAGTEERVSSSIRYADRAGEDLHYRLYAKYFDRDNAVLNEGTSASDAWHSAQAGFRIDSRSGDDAVWTLQGDLYDGAGGQPSAPDITHSGANVLARFARSFGVSDRFQIQTYFDHTHLFAAGDFGDDLDTFDIDAQYELDAGSRQRLMFGAAYRFTHNEIDNLPGGIAFLPATLDRHLVSAFVQDEITLLENRLKVTLGSKLEHNDYTDIEIQPSVRAAWTLEPHFVWAAISRAVRTPSRIDTHLFFPAEPPFLFAGGPGFDSEKVVAYEGGWRSRPHENVSLSLAAFFNEYDDIRTTSPEPPFVIENNAHGEIYGLELEGIWQATPRWRVTFGYTLLQADLRAKPGRADLNSGRGELFDPEQQFQLRTSWDLSGAVELDVWLRYVDRIVNTARGFQTVPDYVALDARVGWSVLERLELAVVGQNLLDDQHLEFGFTEIERSVYGKATWRF